MPSTQSAGGFPRRGCRPGAGKAIPQRPSWVESACVIQSTLTSLVTSGLAGSNEWGAGAVDCRASFSRPSRTRRLLSSACLVGLTSMRHAHQRLVARAHGFGDGPPCAGCSNAASGLERQTWCEQGPMVLAAVTDLVVVSDPAPLANRVERWSRGLPVRSLRGCVIMRAPCWSRPLSVRLQRQSGPASGCVAPGWRRPGAGATRRC